MPRKTASDDLSSFTIETEDTVPKQTRGKSTDPFVLQIRDQLMQAEQDGKARSFSGVDSEEKRLELGTKVRAAGKAIGSDYKVKTFWNKDTNKVYWGPASVIDSLSGKTTTAA